MPAQPTKVPLVSRDFVAGFRQRCEEVFGIVLVASALFVSVALAFYAPLHPSWNTVGESSVRGGLLLSAYWLADILRQCLGWAAWSIPFQMIVFGVRLIRHSVRFFSLRTLFLLLFTPFFLCLFCQGLCMNQVVTQNALILLPSGGAVGLFSLRKILALLHAHHSPNALIPLLFGFLAMFLWFIKIQIGMSIQEIVIALRRVQIGLLKIYRRLALGRIFESSPFHRERSLEAEGSVEPTTGGSQPDETASGTAAVQKQLRRRAHRAAQMELPLNDDELPVNGYRLPPVDLLVPVHDNASNAALSKEQLAESSRQLLSVLFEFGVNGEILNAQPGPIVTMFEFRPAPGIKTSRVISLADDIARSMSALSARIANIPGKNAIGIEIPNQQRQTVYLRPLLNCSVYRQTSLKLPLILGKDIFGHPVLADLSKMPHLLVAGTTGSGKSVSINTMILSLLFKFSPESCRFIMVDPKMLELSVYNDIPHLLTPVVTEPKKAVYALKWAVREMESRYKAMSRLGVRNIDGFNLKVAEGQRRGTAFTQRIQTGFDTETGLPLFEDRPLDYQPLPYIVIVVDEMADLMLVAGKEIEMAVQRLAQMARAAGIHLIMATQRPSVDVITGTIKANFPTRISFQVTSKIDSRTILGEQGAEHLLGHGDMLFMSGGGRIQRVHGPFASDDDVEAVAAFLKEQAQPDYVDGITDETDGSLEDLDSGTGSDDLFTQAVDLVRRDGRVSISYIQRNFQIGYNKAAKLVEQMEKQGIVSPPDRSGKRELLDA